MFIGYVYSLMIKVFQNNKEPLFGRADRILYLKHFQPDTIRKILQYAGQYANENVFFVDKWCAALSGAVEAENFTYLKRILDRDLSSFSGFMLERLFQNLVGLQR